MKKIFFIVLALASATVSFAQEVTLEILPLIKSPLYEKAEVKRTIIKRIDAGAYDGYKAELCIDDPKRCKSSAFEPYKTEKDGKVSHTLRLEIGMWHKLPSEVQEEVVQEIIYDTWGHEKRSASPLAVTLKTAKDSSPFDRLSPNSGARYLKFSPPEYLLGGLGSKAYGPNCWYNSIAAIADEKASYAFERELQKASWAKHRFMGPTEFRFHLRMFFDEVESPEFGDIIRYYTDEEIYSGIVFGGEIHAAVYVGREVVTDKYGNTTSRDIALTKNGRSDLDFLIFQDVSAMDEVYLSKLSEDNPLIRQFNEKDPRRKGFFRVRKGSKILDPGSVGISSDSYAAFLIDQFNYKDRWACLAGRIKPPPGGNTMSFNLIFFRVILPKS